MIQSHWDFLPYWKNLTMTVQRVGYDLSRCASQTQRGASFFNCTVELSKKVFCIFSSLQFPPLFLLLTWLRLGFSGCFNIVLLSFYWKLFYDYVVQIALGVSVFEYICTWKQTINSNQSINQSSDVLKIQNKKYEHETGSHRIVRMKSIAI